MTDHAELDQSPYDESETAAQVAAVLALLPGPDARVLDLGCGRGRIGGPLAAAGHRVHGVDLDPGHEPIYLEAVGSKGRFTAGDLRGPLPALEGGHDAVVLLGNVVMTIREPQALRDLLAAVTATLSEEGVVVIDDFAEGGWAEVASGRWADGVDESGTMQMAWLPGDPEFAVRVGSDVDPDRPDPDPGERILRLWSRRELDDAASFAGLGPAEHDAGGLITVHRRIRGPGRASG